MVPHITWKLWRELGWAEGLGDMLDAQWPELDEQALIADEVELMLQVNGKLRGSLVVPQGAEKTAIEQAAAEHAAVLKYLEGRPAKRIIVVPGKLVNVVG